MSKVGDGHVEDIVEDRLCVEKKKRQKRDEMFLE